MPITPSEKTILRRFVRTNPRMVRIGWWLEHHDIGITLSELVDEPGLFKGVKTLKQARKRVYSEAGKRYLTIRALHGEPSKTIPWLTNHQDPRPKQGPQQELYYSVWTSMANSRQPNFTPLTGGTLGSIIRTAADPQNNSKP